MENLGIAENHFGRLPMLSAVRAASRSLTLIDPDTGQEVYAQPLEAGLAAMSHVMDQGDFIRGMAMGIAWLRSAQLETILSAETRGCDHGSGEKYR